MGMEALHHSNVWAEVYVHTTTLVILFLSNSSSRAVLLPNTSLMAALLVTLQSSEDWQK